MKRKETPSLMENAVKKTSYTYEEYAALFSDAQKPFLNTEDELDRSYQKAGALVLKKERHKTVAHD